MSQSVARVPFREVNNHKQGRTGSKVKIISGPAVGRTSGNPTKRGGVMTPTKGKKG